MVFKFCKKIWKLSMREQKLLYRNRFIPQSNQEGSRISRLYLMTDYFVLLLYYYVTQKWTSDILLKSLEEGLSLKFIKKTAEKHGSIASCLPAIHALTGCDTVPKMFAIGKVSALNALQKNPLNHLRILHALPEVIADEANTFAARCYAAKSSVDMAEIKFVCSVKLILSPLLKNRQKITTQTMGKNITWTLLFHSNLLYNFQLVFQEPNSSYIYGSFDPFVSLSTQPPSKIWCNKSIILTA